MQASGVTDADLHFWFYVIPLEIHLDFVRASRLLHFIRRPVDHLPSILLFGRMGYQNHANSLRNIFICTGEESESLKFFSKYCHLDAWAIRTIKIPSEMLSFAPLKNQNH